MSWYNQIAAKKAHDMHTSQMQKSKRGNYVGHYTVYMSNTTQISTCKTSTFCLRFYKASCCAFALHHADPFFALELLQCRGQQHYMNGGSIFCWFTCQHWHVHQQKISVYFPAPPELVDVHVKFWYKFWACLNGKMVRLRYFLHMRRAPWKRNTSLQTQSKGPKQQTRPTKESSCSS